jgi:hypothetical protein
MGLEGTELAPDPPQVALGRPHPIHEPAHLGQQRPLLPRRLFGIPRRLGEPLPLDHGRDPLIQLVAIISKLMKKRDQLGLGHQVQARHGPKLSSMGRTKSLLTMFLSASSLSEEVARC